MRYFLLLFAVLPVISVDAQNFLPTPKNIEAAYIKGTRSRDGSPGKNYWQNTADYDMKISYEPGTRLLTGLSNIVYTNNSPDTLTQIWFKLDQNIYKIGTPRQSRISPGDLSEGVIIDSFYVDDKVISNDLLKVSGTNAILNNQSLPSGQEIRFRIAWHFTLNKGSHLRTGEIEPNAAFIAYFFPRVAVYDDIDGWNRFPYNGSQEFYNDFGNFNVAITVPKDFVVWATGNLKNANEVLTPEYFQRLQRAEQNDAITTIIDSTDLRKGHITANNGSHSTWLFEASSVTDFAFALSDHYLWKSTSLVVDPKTHRRTRVDAVFNAKHLDYFPVVSYARKTVEAMSYTFPAWPYPYPHITVFDGLDQMEYPMMVNDNPLENRQESISLTDHEIFHTMFPFYMGINETKYAWMDEGWATIGEWLISPVIDSTYVDEYGVEPYARSAGTENDLPIRTLSTELYNGYYTNSYPKPAMGYLFVKDHLGDFRFTRALHNYIAQWQGKHPMPNDFFYSMNAGANENLNWFWKKWFFDDGIPDLSITSVKKLSGNKLSVVVTSRGTKPVPVDLIVYYSDNTSSRIHRDISIWQKGNKTVTLTVSALKPVNKLVLTDPHTPDSNKKDNEWKI